MVIFYNIYIGDTRIWDSKYLNRLEMFHTWAASVVHISIVLFTYMVDTVEQRYLYGWFTTAIVCVFLIINLALIIYEMIL